jgi:DNA-binding response OmpR family regulator
VVGGVQPRPLFVDGAQLRPLFVCDTARVTGGGLRVLVVEDDPRIASMIVKGLVARGHGAEIVSTGSGALDRLAAGSVDVMLLDLGLPDIDGLDVLRRLVADGPSIPVIVITARSDPSDRDAALELGVTAYLTKPFAWSDVWKAIDACSARRG